MGVRGLWKVLEPTARPVLLESLRGKALAIDASIWVYHFLKAMRDPGGILIPAAHIIGFFRRICKLIFYEIKPVFVFDGAAPQLKKLTTARRQERRVNRVQTAKAAANKLLTLHLQQHAQERQNQERREAPVAKVSGTIPENAVYLGDFDGPRPGPDASKPNSSTPFQKEDQYHLPEVENIAPIRIDDQRLLTEEELDEYAQKFTNQARMGFIDMHTVDFHSADFKRLPLTTQYQLLNAARLKSRLRMGYTADQLDKMFPSRMEFSRFQINRVAQRNFFTQRLMDLVGLEEDLTHRVSSEKNTEYMLKRNEQGWTLSLEEKSQIAKAKAETKAETKAPVKNTSDDEFEDVDIAPAAQAAEQPVGAKEESPSLPLDTEPEPQTRTVSEEAPTQSSNRQNPSEATAKSIDELFGYEATLKRQSLYDTMDPGTTSKTGSTPGRSMLFPSPGSSMLFTNTNSSRKASVNDTTAEAEPKRVEAPETVAEEEDKQDEPVEQPPWFDPGERTDFGAVEGKQETGNGLMSYEEAQRREREYSSGDESSGDEFETVDVGPPPSDGATLKGTGGRPAEEVDLTVDDSHGDLPGETVDLTTEEDNLVNATTSSSTMNPAGQEKGEEKVEDLESNTNSTRMDQEATEIDNAIADLDTEVVAPEVPKEEAELAKEDELADEEAAEDLAEMFIGETRENERFEKTFARQSVTTRDYAREISNLKGQYAKSTRDADAPTEEMIQECQELLQLFGIPYITAPCEAEAQCAELEKLKLVDGIVTDDGDAFLFAPKVVVYRNMFSQAKYAEVYKSTTIDADLGLSQDKLVELAMLLGSDYTDGLPGIGPVSGVEILAEFDSLDAFKTWWVDAQRFPDQADTSSPLRRRLVKQLKAKLFLPDEFPSHAVRDAYIHPAVDHDATAFRWGTPDLDGLRRFLGRVVGWESEKIDDLLVPVLQEAKRKDLHRKAEKYTSQSSLDDYYSTVRELNLGSKRAAKATSELKKRRK